jgi:hypothetical protein
MSAALTQSKKFNSKKEIERRIATEPNDFTILCPKCYAFETVSLIEGTLVRTKKFSQIGPRIYHDCGSNEPCRLYHIY